MCFQFVYYFSTYLNEILFTKHSKSFCHQTIRSALWSFFRFNNDFHEIRSQFIQWATNSRNNVSTCYDLIKIRHCHQWLEDNHHHHQGWHNTRRRRGKEVINVKWIFDRSIFMWWLLMIRNCPIDICGDKHQGHT